MKSSRMSARPLVLALGLGLASSALGAAVPASAQAAATPPAASGSSVARYVGSAKDASNNKAFFEAVLKSVAAKRAAQPNAQAVTIHYNASQAPSFRSQIASAASIWNSSESNVKLEEASSGADFSYYEGNDSRGSHASTDGHGKGYVFLDYTQNQQYDSVRITTHETGHVLGLPDDYSGPCSELMSGGGAGPSCTNRYPNDTERSKVDELWAAGLAQAPGTASGSTGQPGTAPGSTGRPGTASGSTGRPGTASGSTGQPGTVTGPAGQPSAAPSVRGIAPGRGPGHPLRSTAPWPSWRSSAPVGGSTAPGA